MAQFQGSEAHTWLRATPQRSPNPYRKKPWLSPSYNHGTSESLEDVKGSKQNPNVQMLLLPFDQVASFLRKQYKEPEM